MRKVKIKSIRHFITGILCAVLSLISLGVLIFNGFSMKYFVSAILLILFSLISFIYSFSTKGLMEEIRENVDERDNFLTMKSAHKTLQIANWIFYSIVMILLLLYGFTKVFVFLVSAMTLCSAIVILFILMIIMSCYYEKHE